MPELPEVESVVRKLQPVLPGDTVTRIDVVHPDVLRGGAEPFASSVLGKRIRTVLRRGKNIVIVLEAETTVLVNLGMTGRLFVWDRASTPGLTPRPPGADHIAVSFTLASGRELVYDDTRRFGALEALEGPAWAQREARLGREPFDPELDSEELHAMLSASRSPVRSWLLDQRRLAGVGNIYANEALFRARVHPHRRSSTIRPGEAAALLSGLRDVLGQAIEEGGTTLRDYRRPDGTPGKYQRLLRVYGRAGEACLECGTAIERSVLSNRSTFSCPTCQPRDPRG